jgi:CheY-like chemotaxis protein
MDEQNRILLVDDDGDFIAATRIVLEKSGYDVQTCMSAKECLCQLKVWKPDLIILDVMMESDHAGFDLCRELRKDSDTKDIPILMLTAVDQKYPLNFNVAAGDETWLPVDDFIEKPVEASVLVERIRRLLKREKYVGNK